MDRDKCLDTISKEYEKYVGYIYNRCRTNCFDVEDIVSDVMLQLYSVVASGRIESISEEDIKFYLMHVVMYSTINSIRIRRLERKRFPRHPDSEDIDYDPLEDGVSVVCDLNSISDRERANYIIDRIDKCEVLTAKTREYWIQVKEYAHEYVSKKGNIWGFQAFLAEKMGITVKHFYDFRIRLEYIYDLVCKELS